MPKYLSIPLTETDRAEYAAMRKDPIRIVAQKEGLGYVHSIGSVTTLYLYHQGKYYKGEFQPWQSYRDFEVMLFDGLKISAVFKAKQAITSIPLVDIKSGSMRKVAVR